MAQVPSAFAHALVGATLSTLLPHRARFAWVVGGLAIVAAAPDLDVLAFRFGVAYEHPLGHRGLSHSLPFAALGGAVSLPFWRRTVPSHAWLAAVLTCGALASHGILDAFTDAGRGVGLLIPFDDTRYFAPWRPLPTSPLSVGAFFSGRGLSILASEACWVGVPTALFLLAVLVARRTLRRRT